MRVPSAHWSGGLSTTVSYRVILRCSALPPVPPKALLESEQ